MIRCKHCNKDFISESEFLEHYCIKNSPSGEVQTKSWDAMSKEERWQYHQKIKDRAAVTFREIRNRHFAEDIKKSHTRKDVSHFLIFTFLFIIYGSMLYKMFW